MGLVSGDLENNKSLVLDLLLFLFVGFGSKTAESHATMSRYTVLAHGFAYSVGYSNGRISRASILVHEFMSDSISFSGPV